MLDMATSHIRSETTGNVWVYEDKAGFEAKLTYQSIVLDRNTIVK